MSAFLYIFPEGAKQAAYLISCTKGRVEQGLKHGFRHGVQMIGVPVILVGWDKVNVFLFPRIFQIRSNETVNIAVIKVLFALKGGILCGTEQFHRKVGRHTDEQHLAPGMIMLQMAKAPV